MEVVDYLSVLLMGQFLDSDLFGYFSVRFFHSPHSFPFLFSSPHTIRHNLLRVVIGTLDYSSLTSKGKFLGCHQLGGGEQGIVGNDASLANSGF